MKILKSFKFTKKHFYTILIDFITFWVIALLLISFGFLLQSKMGVLMPKEGIEASKLYLLSAPVEELQQYASQMQQFVVLLILGMILLLFGSLFIFSYSRALIWNKLLNKKLTRKSYWKWNWLNLSLLVLSIFYVLIYLIVKLIFLTIITVFNNPSVNVISNSATNLIAIIIYLVILFLIYMNFTEKHSVFQSIGTAFKTIKEKWSKIWRFFLMVLLVVAILSALLYPLGIWLQYRPRAIQIIGMLVTFLFLAWVRIYLLRTIKS